MRSKKALIAATISIFALHFSGCSETNDDSECKGTGPARCLGAFEPDEIATSADGKELTLAWEAGDTGPICVNGGNYRSFIRLGEPNAKTVSMYLPNDGAWLPKSTPVLLSGGAAPTSLSAVTQTNFTSATHPILGPSDFLYISACDGSLNVGDRDYTTEELNSSSDYKGKDPRYYRGYINAAASINELARRNPNPEKVIVVGSGAGSFGAIVAAMYAAASFPNSTIYVLQDGSPGFGMGMVDPSFAANLIDGWGVQQTLPKDCPDCHANGHLTNYVDYALRTNSNIRYAVYASSNDSTIPLFVNLSRKPGEKELKAEHIKCFIQTEMEKLRVAHADTNHFNYFVVEGTFNTVASLQDPENPEIRGEAYTATRYAGGEGISFADWFEQFVNDDEAWESIAEISMSPAVENCEDL